MRMYGLAAYERQIMAVTPPRLVFQGEEWRKQFIDFRDDVVEHPCPLC